MVDREKIRSIIDSTATKLDIKNKNLTNSEFKAIIEGIRCSDIMNIYACNSSSYLDDNQITD